MSAIVLSLSYKFPPKKHFLSFRTSFMVFKGSVAVRKKRVSKEINNRYPEYHYGEFVITFFLIQRQP